MRRLLAILMTVIVFSPMAFGACPKTPPAVFAKDLASAYASNTLPSLDNKYPDIRPLQIFIEHSLGEEENGATIYVTSVPSFLALAKLLQSRQTDGLPQPVSRALRKCSNGVCSYDFLNGIQHNTLYLKEIRYNDYVKCLAVETLWFLDGD